MILVVVGGFFFIEKNFALKTRFAREDGNRLYFYSAAYGVLAFIVLLLLARIATSVVEVLRHLSADNSDQELRFLTLGELFPSGLEVALISLFVPLVCYFAGVLFTAFVLRYRPDVFERVMTSIRETDELAFVLYKSLTTSVPVQLTLSNGKVYVGYPVSGADPGEPKKYVSILPILSGYRRVDGRVHFTTPYESIFVEVEKGNDGQLGGRDLSDFVVHIPVDALVTFRLHDFNAYEMFQRPDQEPSAPARETEPMTGNDRDTPDSGQESDGEASTS